MKMISILCSLALLGPLAAPAQLFGKKNEQPQQQEANALRVYLWEYPAGDSLAHRDLLQDTAYAVIMWRFNGTPVEVVMSAAEFRSLQSYFSDSSFLAAGNEGGLYGFEYLVSYNESFSRLKKEDIKAMKSPKKERVAAALNNTMKYILRSAAPVVVRGKRLVVKDEVRIVPDFEEPVASEDTETLRQQTVPAKKPVRPPRRSEKRN